MEFLIDLDQDEVEQRNVAIQALDIMKEFITTKHRHFEKFSGNVMGQTNSGDMLGRIEYHKSHMYVIIQSETVRTILENNEIFDYKAILKFWGEKKIIHTQTKRNAIHHQAFETRVVKFIFNRTTDSLLPWYYFEKNEDYVYEKAPVSAQK